MENITTTSSARSGVGEDVLRARKAPAADLFCEGRRPGCGVAAQLGVALHELGLEALEHAEHVVDDQHLAVAGRRGADRSEEHTSELQSLMRTSYAVFCLKKKTNKATNTTLVIYTKD